MLPRRDLTRLVALCGVLLGSGTWLQAEGVDGFTEPYQEIEIAASEMGIIDNIAVKEGDRVTRGQLLARLDDTVLEVTLRIARSAMESRGRLESAAAELALRSAIVSNLEQLRDRRHASQQELDRAQAEQRIAEAQLKSVREEHEIKMLEYERARAQLERRRLTSPIDGIVTQIFKDCGEFVSPNDPVILKVVQLDPLLVMFPVPAERARELTVGQTVNVRFAESTATARGEVEFVSPTADPQSGTTRVRVRIPNPEERLPSGAMCRLMLGQRPTPLAGVSGR